MKACHHRVLAVFFCVEQELNANVRAANTTKAIRKLYFLFTLIKLPLYENYCPFHRHLPINEGKKVVFQRVRKLHPTQVQTSCPSLGILRAKRIEHGGKTLHLLIAIAVRRAMLEHIKLFIVIILHLAGCSLHIANLLALRVLPAARGAIAMRWLHRIIASFGQL